MNRSDHALLLEMSDRELADIGISRSDLPRLCTGCVFGGYFYDAFLCQDAILYDRTKLLHDRPAWRPENEVVVQRVLAASIRVGAALSAALVTWAIVNGMGSALSLTP